MSQQLLAASESLVGTVLLGRYRVVRELAKGGMGVVYLARAEGAVGFVKPVVIKLLLPEHNEDPRIVRMFVREARILSQLRHPSLVDVIEFGEQDGAYVLVLEYVRGYHLGLWMRYLAAKQREAPADLLLQITIDVLDALHHAHTQVHPDGSSMQIVHRDVSPSNILLDESGQARLLDFGVARMRGGSQDYKTQVQGGFMGKLPYTAPELFSGAEASPQSDLYACAVVLHEALFGQNVFRAETQAATLARVLTHTAEPVERARPDAPEGLDAVLGCALAKMVSGRHADASELAAALRRLLTTRESELRARLAQLLTNDFGPEMSRMFNLESLVDREAAWRTESEGAKSARKDSSFPANSNAGAALRPGPHTPAPLGATVANPRGTRATQRSAENSAPDLPPADASPTANQTTAPQSTGARSRTGGAVAAESGAAPPPSAAGIAGKRTARARTRWLGLGLLLSTAIGLGVWARLHAVPPSPPPVASVPLPQTTPAPQPSAATITRPPDRPDHTEHPDRPDRPDRPDPTERPEHTDKPRRTTPNANALTRALRKQQPRLEACFRQHSTSVEGQATTQLVFDLDASGTLTHVELSPKVLTTTALGQCLLKVARSTPFPAQPRAVSFVIPLTAHAGPDG